MTGATTNRRVTTSIVAGLALVALIVHLLTIHRYGYFRDELYYIACARHLDFGCVDLAPLSAFFLRIELILFGSSLFALRIFPALASAIHFEVPRTETSHTAALPQLYADQFGWEEMVRSVARVYASLPANEQNLAAIFCQNYGEAGAIDFLARNMDYRQRSPDIKIIFTGDRAITLAR